VKNRWASRSSKASASRRRSQGQAGLSDRHLAALQGKFQQACQLWRNGYLGKIHTVEVAAPGPKYQPKYKGTLEPQPVPPGFDWTCGAARPLPSPTIPAGLMARLVLIWDYCAGFIANWGVHHLDIANWGCPEIGTQPFELQCTTTYRTKASPTTWRPGTRPSPTPEAEGPLHRRASPEARCRFVGDKGWLYIDRSGISAGPESL